MDVYLSLRHEIRVVWHQIRMLVKRMLAQRGAFWLGVLGMLLNNILFFVIWILIFRHVPYIKGWALNDVAMMYGMGATCFGLSGALFGGYRMVADDIDGGRFDAYLCKPVSPLGLALTSHTLPQAWGDAITGPVFWILFCHLSVAQFALLMLMSVSGMLICLSVGVMIYSIGFWLGDARNHADTLLYWTTSFLTTPLHGLPYWIKLVLFTALPMAYVSYVPIEMVRDPSFSLLLMMMGGTVWAIILGRFVFYRGLRQYKGVSTLRTGV